MDYAHGQIDIRIQRLSNRLQKEYTQALKDLQDKARVYFDKFQKQDKEQRERWKNGEITKAEYIKWRKNKMLTTKRYDQMITEMSQDLTHTDEIARNMIYKSVPYSYADAFNYSAYEIEKATLQANFTIYNYDAAYELCKNQMFLPPPSKPQTIPKVLLYNKRMINSAIMQGILQGESIPKMAQRLQNVTNMSKNAAMRNARTIHTAAENKGRQDCFERAEEMGIEMAREWIATHDERTRDAHRELDGQIRGMNEPFENAIGKIMYPADPHADPANVYNCRCGIRGVLKDYPYQTNRYSGADYQKWKKGKNNGNGK